VEAILGQYTDLYDFAPVGYFTLDRDGAIRGANLTGARLLGVDRSGLVNRRFGLFVSADSRPAFNAFLKKVFESQAKETCELALRKEANDPLWAHIEAAATQDGQACRAAVVDITKRKRAEAEVQAVQEKLSAEQRRGQRHLKKVIRELEHRNRDLQDFVRAASHDLRAPLVNIRGFGDLWGQPAAGPNCVASTQDGESLRAGLRPLLDEEIPESLDYIRTSSSKMDALLTGLLNVSRIGSAALTIEQLDLNQMVAEIVKSTEFSVEQAGATVQVDALPPCRGDANQLGQVFSNLLDNALKYLDPTRRGVIRVSGHQKQNEVVYCVEDNGIGIDSEHQDAIFGLFHRLNPDRGGGQGLGLTIVRRSLDRQDGKIWLESTPNQGSKFFVSLPPAPLPASACSKLHRQSETKVPR
jgi:PAS domain S-box-containing protein